MDCLPSPIHLVPVKTLAASFGITTSSMRKAILAMGIETHKARFRGSRRYLLAITEQDAKKVRQSRVTQVVEASRRHVCKTKTKPPDGWTPSGGEFKAPRCSGRHTASLVGADTMRVYYSTSPICVPRSTTLTSHLIAYLEARSQFPASPHSPCLSGTHQGYLPRLSRELFQLQRPSITSWVSA